ncbi:MAG: hypothetical protein IJ043_00470 [Clostridia bacterium]|nr:hypothetical protein [Clostridia bacterium]
MNTAHSYTIGYTTTSFDFQSIMTHEIGHVWGLRDKYQSFASNWTMYGYVTEVTPIRRGLHTYDLKAARQIYASQLL